MANTEQQIFERADATAAVANTLFSGNSGYQWDEMSLFDFASRIASARNARRLADDKKADYDAQRGVVNALFDDLETRKIQALGMAKYRFRKDAEVIAMLVKRRRIRRRARRYAQRGRRVGRGVEKHRPDVESDSGKQPRRLRSAQFGSRDGAKNADESQIQRAQSGHRPERALGRTRRFVRRVVWRRHARLSGRNNGR